MELRMVVRRARRQSLTILGDIAQRTSEAGLTTWADVLPAAGVAEFAERELLLSYRVPQDFLALAQTVADGGTRVPRGVRRAPWPPVAVRVADEEAVGPAVAELASAMSRHVGSVGVVTPAGRFAALKAALAPLRAADGTRQPLSAGVNLLDLRVVKGLEFDALVAVEPAAILAQRPDGGPGGLYTALTRSTRALAIVHAHDLPAALAASPELERAGDAATAAGRFAAPARAA
jgi:DNA helicase IV